jgi:MFS family permease
VNVALPSIKTSLGFSDANLHWVISAYTLVAGGFLLLGGRVADIVGRRRMFIFGLAVFSGGSLMRGLAWSEGVLIAFRAVQGFGAAFVAPSALALITALFEEGHDRNRALGVMGAVSGSGAAFGVLLGGVRSTCSRRRARLRDDHVSQQIGGALGTAIVISVATSRFNDLVGVGKAQDVAWTGGFQRSFWICLAFCVVGFVVTLLIVRHVRVPKGARRARAGRNEQLARRPVSCG